MRATVMYGAGDVRVENVPDARHRRADRRPRPRHPRLHLRQRPVALQQMEPSEAGRRMGHELIGVVEAVGADVRTAEARATSSSRRSPTRTAPASSADEGLHTSCLHGGFFGTARAWTAPRARRCASRRPTERSSPCRSARTTR